MYNRKVPNMLKPTILTAKHYDTKVSVEFEYSDISLDEVMDGFQTLLMGMGFHADGFKQWVIDRADEYDEDDNSKTLIKIPIMYYIDENGNKVYDFEEMTDTFENQLSQLDENVTIMCSVEDSSFYKPNEALKTAAERYVDAFSEKEIDEAIAQHNLHEDGFDDYGQANNNNVFYK